MLCGCHGSDEQSLHGIHRYNIRFTDIISRNSALCNVRFGYLFSRCRLFYSVKSKSANMCQSAGRRAARQGSIQIQPRRSSRLCICAMPRCCCVIIEFRRGLSSPHMSNSSAARDILTAPMWWGIISRIKSQFIRFSAGASFIPENMAPSIRLIFCRYSLTSRSGSFSSLQTPSAPLRFFMLSVCSVIICTAMPCPPVSLVNLKIFYDILMAAMWWGIICTIKSREMLSVNCTLSISDFILSKIS